MLGLFGAKSSHPLADAKEARRICAELAALEPSAIVDETAGWFESLAGLDDIATTLRYKRTLELAALSLPAARRQTREYLASQRTTRLQEQQSWQRNRGYWVHLTHVLARCLDDADALRAQLDALLAGLLIAQFGTLRWTQLRYGSIDGSLWAAIGQTYLRAVQGKIAERPVRPFEATADETTVEREYLKILVFHAASMDNLLPIEIGLAERLIDHFLPHFSLSAELRPESVYWVDAGKPLPPTRLAKVPAVSPGLRFFGPGAALAAVAQLREKVAASGTLPADVNLGGQYAPGLVLPVLDHLSMCWSPKPPTRNHTRHRIKSRVGIVAGLAAMQKLLGEGSLETAESWLVDDVSQGGMGVKLPLQRNEWVRIGALVGMQPEGGDNWLIGVIRRFCRETETQGAVGIETLSKSAQAAVATDGALQTELILLAPLQDDASIRILLRADNWEEGVPMQTMVNGRPWRLYPEEKLEAGDEWLIGRCIAEALDAR
jgi:hypothetical protein